MMSLILLGILLLLTRHAERKWNHIGMLVIVCILFIARAAAMVEVWNVTGSVPW